MKRTFGIIGGDQRQAELAKLLAAEGHEVSHMVWTAGVLNAVHLWIGHFQLQWLFFHCLYVEKKVC